MGIGPRTIYIEVILKFWLKKVPFYKNVIFEKRIIGQKVIFKSGAPKIT